MNSPLRVHVEDPALPEFPIEKWLSPKEVAGHFGLSPFSAYRWRSNGFIPPAYVKKFGGWFYKFHPAVVSVLEKNFEEAHSKSAADRVQPARTGAAE